MYERHLFPAHARPAAYARNATGAKAMTDTDKALWMAMGYKVKVGARKMAHELADWDLFKLTFGFYQWKNRTKPTDEQLECLEQGFRHEKKPRLPRMRATVELRP